jgi:NADPH:quinone reductase-like Zn-dependent oxidoreductase
MSLVFQTIMKAICLRGIQIGSVAQYALLVGCVRAQYLTRGSRFKDMIRLMCANPESTRPVVDKVFSFQEAKAAYAYLESQAHVGKVVIKVSEN